MENISKFEILMEFARSMDIDLYLEAVADATYTRGWVEMLDAKTKMQPCPRGPIKGPRGSKGKNRNRWG